LNATYAMVFAWLTVLLIGGIWFRRRDPGRNPGYAGILQFVVPGLGYAYLHRWDRFLFGYVTLLLGAFFFDRVLHLEDRFLVLFAVLGVAAMTFDCILTAARMARREKAEEARGRSRK
jgi:hypothetical protein